MNDVGKIRYLIVERTGSRKLKRPVPKDVQHLAGQKNFVRRVGALSAAAIRVAANRFASETDREIERLRTLLHTGNREEPTGSRLDLDDRHAEKIARTYFTEEDRGNVIAGRYTPPIDADDLAEMLSDASGQAEDALREHAGEFRTSSILALHVLRDQGVISDQLSHSLLKNGWPEELELSPSFRYLCRLLERAELALAKRKYASLNRGSLVSVDDPMFAPTGDLGPLTPTSRSSAKTLADLKTMFLDVKGQTTGRSRQEQFKLPFRILEEQFGADKLLSRITREDARSLLPLLPRIPAHATKRYGQLHLVEAAAVFERENARAAERYDEAEKHLRVIAAAFRLAVDDGWLSASPFQGLKIVVPRARLKKHVKGQQTYLPYSIDQLNKLFALPLFTGSEDDERGCHRPGPHIMRRHRYWTPIIALWTGMRMNEILQLEKADFKRSEDGVDYIDVTDEDHQDYSAGRFTKRLKTANSLRRVPVHASLIKLGLMDWVECAPDGRLFPEASIGTGEKASDLFSKRYRSNAKHAGVWVAHRYVFHSFRNTFNDALRAADVNLELREAIQGWREQKSMDERYGKGMSVKQLSHAVNLVAFPGLTIGRFSF